MSDQPDMKNELSKLQGSWQTAREKTANVPVQGKPPSIPDGRWQIIVERVELGRARDRQPQLEWVLLIQNDGDFKGRRIWHNKKITEKSLEYVMKDLKMCGIDIPNIEEIAAYLPQARGVELEITYKTSGEYRDVYFNKRLADSFDNSLPHEGTPDGDDAPLN